MDGKGFWYLLYLHAGKCHFHHDDASCWLGFNGFVVVGDSCCRRTVPRFRRCFAARGLAVAQLRRRMLALGAWLEVVKQTIPEDPWDERYIYLHEWLIFMVNVGKYTIHGSSGNGRNTLFLVGGWTNQLKNMRTSNWMISPILGVKIKNIWVATSQQ